MKTDFYILLISVFCTNFCFCCSNSNSILNTKQGTGNKLISMNAEYKKMNYESTLLLIDKRCEDGGTWDALFADKDFIEIYECVEI